MERGEDTAARPWGARGGGAAVSTRRGFLSGAAALCAFGGRVFAAPAGWRPPGSPVLTFGVVSDTHLRISRKGGYDAKHWPDRYLVAALRAFRERNVDAVVHCGDMADRGVADEMGFHATAWRKVFPDDRAADGRPVAKLFINGNHDVEGGGYGKGFRLEQIWPDPAERESKLLSADMAGNWARIWGERHEPVWHKTVKGCHFFGMDWGRDEMELAALIDARCAEFGLDEGSKPFFFITHDRTHGAFHEAVKRHPNAFGLWGHWHRSAANWNTVELLAGVVPGVQCPACYPYFADGRWLGGGDSGCVKAPLEGKLAGGAWRQGLVVRVYGDILAIERLEFSCGGSLGADWIMPFGERSPHPFSRGELEKAAGVPRFRDGARLSVSAVPGALRVAIPPADGDPASRVYAYDIAIEAEGGGRKPLRKAVYAAGCNLAPGRAPEGGVTALDIPAAELPPGGTLVVAVRPVTSLGTAGGVISARAERPRDMVQSPT